MTGLRRSRSQYVLATVLVALAAWHGVSNRALSQLTSPPPGLMPDVGLPAIRAPGSGKLDPALLKEQVVDVRVFGNQAVPLTKITAQIKSRAGRPFDPELIEEDVRR